MHARSPIWFALTSVFALGCEGDVGPEGPPGPPGIDPDLPAIDKLFAGAGGKDALLALTSFRIEAAGERLLTLEGFTPEDDAHPISTFTATTTADVAGDRLRLAYAREIPLFGASPAYDFIVAGDVGVQIGVESVFGFPGGDLPSDRWAAITRQHRLLHPQLILRELADGTRTASDAGLALRDGQIRHRIDVSDAVRPISLFVDRYTGELTELETYENDYVAGDTPLEVHYLGWRTWDDGGVRFPADVIIALGDQPMHAEHRDAIATNLALDPQTFAFPAGSAPDHVATDAARGAKNGQFHEGFAALGIPLDGLQTYVEAEQLATGVWHLRGGSHHSLVIEQTAGVVVVEAPLYEARAQAIYEWIAATIPNKPVTHVVSTHHHRDHVGALRTFVARGARVVVGEAARPYFSRAFRATRTIDPDELAATPRAATIDTVRAGGTLVIADQVRPVHVVAVDSIHAADLVVAYVPAAKAVFVSDIYSPGLPGSPLLARELRDTIVQRGLDVTTIAGGHGGVGNRAELDAASGL
jgi:glyoxylase-like metal-dependent hydrolase (beta-lactamase superfamily II)